MLDNEKNNLPDNENTSGLSAPATDNHLQQVLEKRLAEINARKEEGTQAMGGNPGPGLADPTVVPQDELATGTDKPANNVVVENAGDAGASENTSAAASDSPASPQGTVNAALPPIESSVVNQADEVSGFEGDLTSSQDIAPDEPMSETISDAVEPNASESTTEAPAQATAESPNTDENPAAPEMSTAGIIPKQEQTAAQQTLASNPDEANAAEANQEHPDEAHSDDYIPEIDYSTLPVPELKKQLIKAYKTSDPRKNARQIFEMYRQYELRLAAEKHEALDKFIADGGDSEDFEFHSSPENQEIEKGFQQFRDNRNRELKKEEEQKEKNLNRKNELLEQLRNLVDAAETKNSADKLKAIQSEWKAIGAVPTSDSQQLWNSYHALLDKFYNNRSIFFELKELDRKKNLQQKMQLVERAESLLQNPSINASLQELRHLHEEWKNIGPVPNESRDAIWERFIQASEKIHERKKEYLNVRKAQEQENLQRKLNVLEVIAPYQTFNSDRINDWRDKTDEIQKIKEQWDSIGLVPKENADEVNKRFWSSYKAFYQHKNAFFKQLDEQKMQNLRHKTELCEQAEALKDSTDWDETKERLIQLQKKWKTIGRVPDKYSDKIWNRFRAACNEFFDRKQNQQSLKEAEQERAASEKIAYYDKLASRLSHSATTIGSLEEFNTLLTEWRSFDEAGGRANPKLEERFFDLLQKYLDTVPDLSYERKNDLIFQLQLDRLRQHPDASHKLYQKEQNIRKEISSLENDISTLKTNIEFFARSKNAEKLREEYQQRIEEANTRMNILKKQLRVIRS
ncbi:DUF349 domain-containing protein [Adhaeribacter swui]|nr:DUF349 domain-containing protein [Adhaeribacter swui]